jgi:hypothetical protein
MSRAAEIIMRLYNPTPTQAQQARELLRHTLATALAAHLTPWERVRAASPTLDDDEAIQIARKVSDTAMRRWPGLFRGRDTL